MSHNLLLVFPLPVTLAFAAMVILLLALARVVTVLRKPAPVRIPAPRAVPQGGGIDAAAEAEARHG